MQNVSFELKKNERMNGRRGYKDGSHSEIEVSREANWDAERIFSRGMKLLKFIEKRWGIQFKDEAQMIELLHIGFVNEQREDVPELPED